MKENIQQKDIGIGDTDSIGIDYESAVTKYCSENQKDINDLSRRDIRMITKDLMSLLTKTSTNIVLKL